jgi:hypothetical protein
MTALVKLIPLRRMKAPKPRDYRLGNQHRMMQIGSRAKIAASMADKRTFKLEGDPKWRLT